MAKRPPDSPVSETTIWTDGRSARTVAAVLDALGPAVRPLAVGGPRADAITDLARQLDRPCEDDLRKLLVHYPAAFVLLATAKGVRPEHLHTAVEHGTTVLSLEPVADDLPALAELTEAPSRRRGGVGATYGHVVHAPAFVASPGHLSAAEPHEALGPQRTVLFQSVGRPGEGSLFARLFDAWRTVLTLAPMPLTIDATLVAEEPDVPQSLRRIAGSMTAHARLPGAGAVVLSVADRAGATHRHLHVLGDAAELRVTDTGYTLHQATGQLLDRGNPYTRLPFAELVAHQWRSVLDRRPAAAADAHPRDADALACCLTCLLSARTAAPEDPRRILELRA